MNDNENKRNMMYGKIPAVVQLNKVPGFDPLQFLRLVISDKTQEKLLKLDLRYQKLWFRLAHPHGRMKLTALRITDQMAIFEAKGLSSPFEEEGAFQQTPDFELTDSLPVPAAGQETKETQFPIP